MASRQPLSPAFRRPRPARAPDAGRSLRWAGGRALLLGREEGGRTGAEEVVGPAAVGSGGPRLGLLAGGFPAGVRAPAQRHTRRMAKGPAHTRTLGPSGARTFAGPHLTAEDTVHFPCAAGSGDKAAGGAGFAPAAFPRPREAAGLPAPRGPYNVSQRLRSSGRRALQPPHPARPARSPAARGSLTTAGVRGSMCRLSASAKG